MNDGRQALSNQRNPEAWLNLVEQQGHGLIEREILTPEETADEMLLMGLRLREGLDLKRFSAITGSEIDPDRVRDLVGYGMVEHAPDNRLRATPSGALVLDAVIADLAA